LRKDSLAEFDFVEIGRGEVIDANLRSVLEFQLPEIRPVAVWLAFLRLPKHHFNRNVRSFGK
jgi:hypothetical protein